MAQDKLKPTLTSSLVPACRLLIIILLFISEGCASTKGPSIITPQNIIPELKGHESIEVQASRQPWTPTGLNLKTGDTVVVFASGQVTEWTTPPSLRNLPPYSRLYMKIGEKYFPHSVVGQLGYQILYVRDSGQLMFAMKNWDSLDRQGNPVYESFGPNYKNFRDHSGSFTVDVFVFKTDSIERIINILETIAYHNPTNYRLRMQIAEFIRYEKTTIAVVQTNHQIEELQKVIVSLKEEKPLIQESAENPPTSTSSVSNQNTSKSQTERDQRLAELELKLLELEQSKSELDKIKLKYEEEKSRAEVLSKELEEKGKREKQLLGKFSEDAKSPPVLLISSPEDQGHSETGIIRILGAAEDDRGIANLEITHNGKLVEGDFNRGIRLSSKEPPRRISFDRNMNIVQGANLISVKVTDIDGLSTNRDLTIHYNPKNLQVWAVVVGINDYGKFPKLKFAVNDAKAVYRYLNENNRVPAENIFLLIDKQASIQNLRNVLGTKLKASAGEKDMVIIYFAGHGSTERDTLSPDGDGLEKYLLAADSDPADIYSTALPMRELGYLFSRIKSERLVFLVDSCYSGASGGRTVENFGFRANISDKFLERISTGRGKIIITASAANEVSAEKDELEHGVFTYFLLEGLNGKADTDSDKIITVDEIYRYVSDQVPKATGQEQHPVKRGSVEGELVLGVNR
jgi:hypothetical protein